MAVGAGEGSSLVYAKNKLYKGHLDAINPSLARH